MPYEFTQRVYNVTQGQTEPFGLRCRAAARRLRTKLRRLLGQSPGLSPVTPEGPSERFECKPSVKRMGYNVMTRFAVGPPVAAVLGTVGPSPGGF
ncbi:hypothetical protein BH10ACT8_BH10ACT8_18580 [soil metagenome]